MEKDNKKTNKELLKDKINLILSSVGVGTILGSALVYGICALLAFELSLPMCIVLGLVTGGSVCGTCMGIAIKNGYVEFKDVEYDEDDEYDLESDKLEEENTKKDSVSLTVVKGSGSKYSFNYNENDRPKLELIDNRDKKNSRKK